MEATIAITGNTYPVRVELRGMGGVWDGKAKAWMVPAEKAAAARALVANAGPKSPYRKGSSYMRYSHGGYVRCNHEDYPCCGC